MQMPIEQLNLSPKHRTIVQQLLQQHVPHCEVWAYGSRVKGDGHSGSDLDLVLYDCEPAQLLVLQNALQQSLLPMLVDLHRWETLPESFQQNIQQQYIVLQQ